MMMVMRASVATVGSARAPNAARPVVELELELDFKTRARAPNPRSR